MRGQQAEAVEPRHHHVGQHQIGPLLAHRRQRGLAIGDDVALRSWPPSRRADIVAHVGVIVGQQHMRRAPRDRPPGPGAPTARMPVPGCRRPRSADRRGSQRSASATKDAAAPPSGLVRPRSCDDWSGGRCAMPSGKRDTHRGAAPTSLCTSIVPPCSRTSSLTSARPMPVPSMRPAALAFDAMEAVEDPRQFVRRECRRRYRATVSSARAPSRSHGATAILARRSVNLNALETQVEHHASPTYPRST